LRPAPGEPFADWQPTARLFVSDPEAQVDLAVAGAGIIQVAYHHAAADLAADRLQRVLADLHDPDEREVVLHYPHRQFLSPRVRVVVDALLAHLAATPVLHFDPHSAASA
jgi:DNA-binding transcriptional LysR family regulator